MSPLGSSACIDSSAVFSQHELCNLSCVLGLGMVVKVCTALCVFWAQELPTVRKNRIPSLWHLPVRTTPVAAISKAASSSSTGSSNQLGMRGSARG